MRKIFTTTIFILFSKLSFGQKLLWQSIDKKKEFKYEYCFVLNENSVWNADRKDRSDKPKNDTLYQINSKKRLNQEELNMIMNCVKNSSDKEGNINPSKCSEYKKYTVSIQI